LPIFGGDADYDDESDYGEDDEVLSEDASDMSEYLNEYSVSEEDDDDDDDDAFG
jgi:hypothetical protein